MIKKIGFALAVAVVIVLNLALLKPNSFRVARSVSVNAPAEKIFPLLNDLRAQGAWSPWEKKDPGMKRSFSGPAQGVGSRYAWDGNREIGAGSLEITQSAAPTKVVMNLDFLRPMQGRNVAAFDLLPNGPVTEVTWSISGPMPFSSKVMSVFCSMDRMIGKDFEAGLKDLKALAEK